MLQRNPDLLPSNALQSERAQALAARFGDDILPEDIKTLWRPEIAAARFLPFIAWGMHLDFWRDNLPEDVKRDLILGSFAWHRKKGTVWAVKTMFGYLGFVPTIKEWPELETKAHTFSVTGYYGEDPYNLLFLGPDTEKILIDALYMAKPERSHLIFLTVAPPPMDMSGHICRWDWCTWEHGFAYDYPWQVEVPEEGLWQPEVDFCLTSMYGLNGTYNRGDCWDAELWDNGHHSGIRDYVCCEVSICDFASWEDYHPRHRWHGKRGWKCGGTWRESCDRLGGEFVISEYVDTIDYPPQFGS